MSDRGGKSGSTFFESAGRRLAGAVTEQPVGGLPEIRRALGLPGEGRSESIIPAEVRSALGLSSEAGSTADLSGESWPATACFEMHIGSYVIPIEVTVDLATSDPYRVLGGTLTFEGVETDQWTVTEGHFGVTEPFSSPSVLLSDTLLLVAEPLPLTSHDVADVEPTDTSIPTVVIIGWHSPPLSYPGFYFIGGFYSHRTLFRGWQTSS